MTVFSSQCLPKCVSNLILDFFSLLLVFPFVRGKTDVFDRWWWGEEEFAGKSALSRVDRQESECLDLKWIDSVGGSHLPGIQ